MILWFSLLVLLAGSAQDSPDEALRLAQREFESGDYRHAVDTLQGATQAPRDARFQHWLARCYYELRDWDKAVAYAEQAVKLDAGNSEYHRWLGRTYGAKAEETRSFLLARKVKKQFEEAVRLNPADIRARRDLLEYYVEAPWIVGGDKSKARQQIEAIAAMDAVQGHLARADYWKQEDKFEQAEEEYRRVAGLAPNAVDPYLEIADYYQRRNNPAQMEQAVEQAGRVNPQDRRLAYYRGVARVLTGDRLQEAEKLLRSYLESAPQNSDLPSHASAREWLGRLYERQGNRKGAALQYRAALQIDPQHEGARAGLKRVQE